MKTNKLEMRVVLVCNDINKKDDVNMHSVLLFDYAFCAFNFEISAKDYYKELYCKIMNNEDVRFASGDYTMTCKFISDMLYIKIGHFKASDNNKYVDSRYILAGRDLKRFKSMIRNNMVNLANAVKPKEDKETRFRNIFSN